MTTKVELLLQSARDLGLNIYGYGSKPGNVHVSKLMDIVFGVFGSNISIGF
jgi:hypothetical protein